MLSISADNQDGALRQSFEYGGSYLQPGDLQRSMKTYLFGYPIKHSLAPILHREYYRQRSVNWTYTLEESLDTKEFWAKLNEQDCVGSAITMPHKTVYLPMLDDIRDEVRVCGALNTVFKRRDGSGRVRLIGANTDVFGVSGALSQAIPDVLSYIKGQAVLIVGAGATSRSAIYATWKLLDAGKIFIANRLESESTAVVKHFKDLGCEICAVESITDAQQLETPVVIVNVVPDFEPTEEGEIRTTKIVREFLSRPKKGYSLEMCYHPQPFTRFFKLAESEGWKVIGGIDAMINQGIDQQVLWTESERSLFDIEAATAIVETASKEVLCSH
ncbi:hypothetical protein V1511DRAFT_506567 [Dipodascopsis uninucleata]